MAQAWDDPAAPPTEAELDELAELRDGVTSLKDCTESWYCIPCQTICAPKKNLLMNLPAYKCPTCNAKSPITYDWKMPDTLVEGIRLEHMVYDQKETDHCVIHSTVAALDAARRMRGSMYGVYHTAPLSVKGAVETYEQVTGWKSGKEPLDGVYDRYDAFPVALTVLKNHGFPYIRGRKDKYPKDAGRMKIKDFFKVNKDDVAFAERLLANGYPLLAGVDVGALFRFVGGGKPVYCTPDPGFGCGSHGLALHGSGREPREGIVQTYYGARDSAGCKAHPVYDKQGYGGDLNVWASDVRVLWGFRLEEFHVEVETDGEDVEVETDGEDVEVGTDGEAAEMEE